MVDGLKLGEICGTGFRGAALLLVAGISIAALLLLPYAVNNAGSNGPAGLLAAAAICLTCGLVAEGAACFASQTTTPLLTMLLGMAIRMTPPLVLCLFLAAQGAGGRRHLGFIVYLLACYGVTLAAETWLSVNRLNRRNATSR